METTPSIDKAAAFFDAHTVELGLDIEDRVAASSVEFKAGVDAVCVTEEEYTGSDTITSFFEDETSGEPWLAIVEPD